MKILRRTYLQAAKDAATKVLAADFAGQSQITIQSWAAIEAQLSSSAAEITRVLEEQIESKVLTGSKIRTDIHNKYLKDMVTASGADDFITKSGLANMFSGVGNRVIESLIGRIYQDGYTFSDRIWRIGQKYQDTIKDVISVGLAQNRDLIKIAKDIQVYTADGKVGLANRFGMISRRDIDNYRKGKALRIDWKMFEKKIISEYGPEEGIKIIKSTRSFMQRIGNRVDWRALRLVRSELYSSIQIADAEAGRVNPAALDLYDWILEAGRQQWSCACESLSLDGPYKYSEIPGYPHSNCSCSIRVRLRNGNDFESDLKRWVDGESVDYMDAWYRDTYLPMSVAA
jgi:hypothetical protein